MTFRSVLSVFNQVLLFVSVGCMVNRELRSQVYADIKRNRLYIVLKGTVCKKETENIYTDIRFGVSDLQPGFSVITDMRAGRIGYLSASPVVKKITDYLQSREVGFIIRITSEKNLIARQLRSFSENINGYTPIYFSSMEEADAFLDKSEDR